MPGQQLNVLDVPIDTSFDFDFDDIVDMTLDPSDKYTNPSTRSSEIDGARSVFGLRRIGFSSNKPSDTVPTAEEPSNPFSLPMELAQTAGVSRALESEAEPTINFDAPNLQQLPTSIETRLQKDDDNEPWYTAEPILGSPIEGDAPSLTSPYFSDLPDESATPSSLYRCPPASAVSHLDLGNLTLDDDDKEDYMGDGWHGEGLPYERYERHDLDNYDLQDLRRRLNVALMDEIPMEIQYPTTAASEEVQEAKEELADFGYLGAVIF